MFINKREIPLLKRGPLVPERQGGTSYFCPVSLSGSSPHNTAALHNLNLSLAATAASLVASPCKQTETLSVKSAWLIATATLPQQGCTRQTTVESTTHGGQQRCTSALLSMTRVVSHWLPFLLLKNGSPGCNNQPISAQAVLPGDQAAGPAPTPGFSALLPPKSVPVLFFKQVCSAADRPPLAIPTSQQMPAID